MPKATKIMKLAGVSAMPEPDLRYRTEDALRTITRAEECKRDKPLMREVKKLARSQMKSVCK